MSNSYDGPWKVANVLIRTMSTDTETAETLKMQAYLQNFFTDAFVNISFWIEKEFDNSLYDPSSTLFDYTATAVTNKVSCFKLLNS